MVSEESEWQVDFQNALQLPVVSYVCLFRQSTSQITVAEGIAAAEIRALLGLSDGFGKGTKSDDLGLIPGPTTDS